MGASLKERGKGGGGGGDETPLHTVWCLCVFCLFIPFLSVFFVFDKKNLVLLNLINRYVITASE